MATASLADIVKRGYAFEIEGIDLTAGSAGNANFITEGSKHYVSSVSMPAFQPDKKGGGVLHAACVASFAIFGGKVKPASNKKITITQYALVDGEAKKTHERVVEDAIVAVSNQTHDGANIDIGGKAKKAGDPVEFTDGSGENASHKTKVLAYEMYEVN